MQYNIKSSNKSRKRKLLIACIVVSLALIFLFLTNFEGRKQASVNSKTDKESDLKSLLARAEHNISFSPDSAEILALKLQNSSIEQQEPYFLVRSFIVLGNIKKLQGDPIRAGHYYKRAADLAVQNKLIAEECEVILNSGEIAYKKGDFELALQQFLKAENLALINNLEDMQSSVFYHLGKYNQTKGNFDKAKFYYLKSLALSRKKNNEKQLALLLPSLGKYYITEGKLNFALSCYQEAFHISERRNDHFLSADICHHLGGLYLELKEFNKAINYHRMALKYRLDMNYPGELAKSYNSIGKIHLNLHNLDSAEYYFNTSLALCKKTDYIKGLVKALGNLGKVHRIKGEQKAAAAYLHESLAIAKSIGYDNGIAEASLDIGELSTAKNAVDSAIFYYNGALSKFGKTNYNEDLLRVYKGLYGSYVSKADYKTALAYHESVLETEKKLLDVENKRQLAIVNISFDTERKEQDYKVLLKDNELKASLIKSKNTFIWLIVAGLSFTILLCLYVYNRFYIKKQDNKKLQELNYTITDQNIQLKKLNREIESVSKEKDKLFSIISHELRNPLYWLQNVAEVLSRKHSKMPADKISKTLSSLDESAKNVYHLMDNLLHWSRSKLNRVHPVKLEHNLFTLISDTTRIYETFFQQKEISFFIDIPATVYIYADADLLACVVRNLVSNAIKYTPSGGRIKIQHQLNANVVTLVISDSGKGISENELTNLFLFKEGISMPGLLQEKGSGLGLKLCKDFVELNDGIIWVESIVGVETRFFFTVPLQKPKQEVPIKLETVEAEN